MGKPMHFQRATYIYKCYERDRDMSYDYPEEDISYVNEDGDWMLYNYRGFVARVTPQRRVRFHLKLKKLELRLDLLQEREA